MAERNDVERLAYELWEREGKPNGRDQVHYYEAERLLQSGERMTGEAGKPAPRKRGGRRPRRKASPGTGNE